jgi:transcriptional regulator with XRE-family HTH domain
MSGDPIDVATGLKVRILRRERGMSQDKLAEALGLSFQQVQKYERGANRISVSALCRIAAALKVPPSDLIADIERDPVDAHDIDLRFTPGAQRLIEAYARINSPTARAFAIRTIEQLADLASDLPKEPT